MTRKDVRTLNVSSIRLHPLVSQIRETKQIIKTRPDTQNFANWLSKVQISSEQTQQNVSLH
jgi:hypothetical protein